MSKVRVAILRGGPSEEYEVSLKTGQAVITALDRNLFSPIDIVITKSGEWLQSGFPVFPEQVLHCVDVVFIALHGTYGEDGTIQRILERYGSKYTGSGVLASKIAMNKALTKAYLKESGVRMAPHTTVSRNILPQLYNVVERIGNDFGPEYVIKPISSGSSVGVRMVSSKMNLLRELTAALEDHHEVLVEQRVHGKEATCGVIERFRDMALYALPPIEIVPPQQSDFFDNTVKYDGSTEEICPGRFPHETKREIERVAKLVHETLNLSQYSRSDFMVGNDGVYFLEVNTLPGLTSESLLPKAISAVGGTYSDFLTHLLTDALEYR